MSCEDLNSLYIIVFFYFSLLSLFKVSGAAVIRYQKKTILRHQELEVKLNAEIQRFKQQEK